MTRDYILSAEVEDFCEDIPLLDFIYVIPTRRKHDSGYRIMEIVGYSKENDYLKKLDIGCDVVDFNDGLTVLGEDCECISMDIEPSNGFIRIFTRYGKIKVIHRCSAFVFKVVKEKGE